MKSIILLVSLLCIQSFAHDEVELKSRWSEFKKIHGKTYADEATEQSRYQIWVKNLKFIEAHNARYEAGEVSYYLAQNKLSDMTEEERKGLSGLKKDSDRKQGPEIYTPPVGFQIPESVDWRTKGAVTPVKNQNPCGTCWTFSATAAIEGQYFMKYGVLKSFSEQELYDCINGVNCTSGGLQIWAYSFLQHHGLMLEKDYPYVARDQFCHLNEQKTVIKNLKGYVELERGNEENLQIAIAHIGPIAISIDARGDEFAFYAGGVYTNPRCRNGINDLDHAVAAVGYGTTDDGKQYYIVRNSWGADWGNDGYILMARNDNNECGVATDASYPKL